MFVQFQASFHVNIAIANLYAHPQIASQSPNSFPIPPYPALLRQFMPGPREFPVQLREQPREQPLEQLLAQERPPARACRCRKKHMGCKRLVEEGEVGSWCICRRCRSLPWSDLYLG